MSKGETSIVKKSASLSLLVIVGKVLGFIKQAVIAWAFGSNAVTDIYFAADGYASMFGQIMGQTVGPTVLTQYIHLNENGDESRSRKLIRDSYVFFAGLSVAVILINFCFADNICHIIGISYTDEQLSELKYFLVAMLPVVLFTSMIGVSSGYLDSHNRFLPGRLTSLFFSVSIIIFVLLLRNQLGLRSLLYGFLLGYILHMVLMLFLVVPKVGFGISNPFKNSDFRIMIKRFVPLVIGFSVVDLGHLVDKIVASSLEAGSVSALYYGQVVSSDIVSAVIVTSVGSVLLTSITKDVASNLDPELLINRLRKIMSVMTFIIVGITALYFVEGVDLIRLFFQRGSFNESNTAIVNVVAICYSMGFVFTANRDILVKTHYAYKDTTSPMANSIAGVCLNIVLSITLSRFLGIAGIAVATSISMLFVFVLSAITLRKHMEGFIINKPFIVDFFKSLAAFVITLVIGKFGFGIMSTANFFIRMLVIGLTMCVIYFAAGALLRENAAVEVINIGKSKLGRA
ncbi:MAG: polysaccharide biosynthesis protein [Firmicutes bacterium]|nr:polysaccharide biosynthesis protein [Bacillota bacterium]